MTGDGTNDAPALAQADVGVAMNTGTSAAKEAGNMVDLDSNPTKLIEIVAIGKQLLITRGSLTTFSIANDVAKYFAIIPAMFAAVYPGLDTLNVMQLSSPDSAILSAVIFNALIIVALIPLALRGVRYTPSSASSMLRRNLGDLRPRWHRGAVRRDQADRPLGRTGGEVMLRSVLTSLRMLVVVTLVVGVAYPLAVWGIGQVAFSSRANGSLVIVDGRARRIVADRSVVRGPRVVRRPSRCLRSLASGPSNLGPSNPALGDAVRERLDALTAADDPVGSVPVDAVTGSGSGLDPHISPAYARLQAPRVAAARGLPVTDVLALIDAHTEGRTWGFLGEPRVNVLLLNLALEGLASGS